MRGRRTDNEMRFSAVTAKYVYYQRKLLYSHSGDDGGEDPPVPIPNTEVKLTCARSTCLLRLGDKVVAGFQKNTVSTKWVLCFFIEN